MNDLAAIITASGTVLAIVSGLARFIYNKVEARFTEIENKLDECQQRETRHLEERMAFLLIIDLLVSDLRRIRKNSPVLAQARRLLDAMKLEEAAKLLSDGELT